MRISLCTSVKNRFEHIRSTLPFNMGIAASLSHYAEFQFCVCNYDSNDGVGNWLKKFDVKTRRVEEKDQYHQSNAKNCSHVMADGDIIINVDADNYINREYMKEVIRLLKLGHDLISHKSYPYIPGKTNFMQPESFTGEAGRIVVSKNLFEKVGGYDEEFVGWGNDDCDFIYRAEKLGANSVAINPNFLLFKPSIIEHDDEKRTEHTEEKDKFKTLELNIRLATAKYAKAIYIANQNKEIGQ